MSKALYGFAGLRFWSEDEITLREQFQAHADTKADYRAELIRVVKAEIERFTMAETRIVESDRLPTYSESTIDIEAMHNGKWREMASCSIRNDYSSDTKVCEIAIGLDRIATLASKETK